MDLLSVHLVYCAPGAVIIRKREKEGNLFHIGALNSM